MRACLNCGAPNRSCPPWTCNECGQSCSMADPCACWISLEGMGLADLKALFATSDLSLTRVTPPAEGDA